MDMDLVTSAPKAVVVGVDGSPSSYDALRWSVRYAGLVDGTVDAVAVWGQPGLYGWSAPAVDIDVDEEEARQGMLEELTYVLGADTASVRARLVHGNPTDVLLRAAEAGEGSRAH